MCKQFRNKTLNLMYKFQFKLAKKNFLKNKNLNNSKKLLSILYSKIDKCIKKNIFSKNKGAKLKSNFSTI